MTYIRQPLPSEEKDAMRVLLGSLEPFRAIYSTMPLQQAVSFLLVAMEEGCGVSDYAVRAGVSQSVMTRHLLDLGDFDRRHEPGLNLVFSRPNPMNRRKSEVYLTPKGKALAAQIHLALMGRTKLAQVLPEN